VCNDAGGWGKGFVIAVSRRWPEPERRYRAWHRGEEPVAHWSLLIAILAASDFSRAMANCCGRHLFQPNRFLHQSENVSANVPRPRVDPFFELFKTTLPLGEKTSRRFLKARQVSAQRNHESISG